MAQPFVEPCDRGIIAAEVCPREIGREIAPQRRRIVLVACVLASSMAFIDGSALTVALPRLRAFFGADLATVQWVLNGYVLALAALTLIGAGEPCLDRRNLSKGRAQPGYRCVGGRFFAHDRWRSNPWRLAD